MSHARLRHEMGKDAGVIRPILDDQVLAERRNALVGARQRPQQIVGDGLRVAQRLIPGLRQPLDRRNTPKIGLCELGELVGRLRHGSGQQSPPRQ